MRWTQSTELPHIGASIKAREGCTSVTTPHADLNTVTTATANITNTYFPSFMLRYLPTPETAMSLPEDQAGMKRCTVGRPLGKILKLGDGKLFTIGKCDKHADERLFDDNMNEQKGTC